MKKDLPWFRHYAAAPDHPKFEMLRARYGWAGEGRFWAINCYISQATEARLDLSRKFLRATVANRLGMSFDELDEFMEFLSDPEECALLEKDGETYTSQIVQEDYAYVRQQREAARKRKTRSSDEPWESSDEPSANPAEVLTTRTREQSRAEQSRVDKSRAEQSARAREEQPPCQDNGRGTAIAAAAFSPSALKDLCSRYLPSFRGGLGDWAQFAAIMIREGLDAEYVRWLGQVFLPAQRGIENRGAWIRRHFGEEIAAYRTWAVQQAAKTAPPLADVEPPAADPLECEATVQQALGRLPWRAQARASPPSPPPPAPIIPDFEEDPNA